jgi:agmatinase
MNSFFEGKISIDKKEDALFQIIPVPFESENSFVKGTNQGPAKIISASKELELFDGTDSIIETAKIFTHDAINCQNEPQKTLQAIENKCNEILKFNSIPVILGGENIVSLGAINACQNHYDKIGIIQFDAHANLKERTPNSYDYHSTMRHIYNKKTPLFQIGTRALSKEEHQFRVEHEIAHINATDWYKPNRESFCIPEGLPQNLYISIDVDSITPSIIPSVINPVPGGIEWYDMLLFLQQIVDLHTIVGVDIVGLAPQKNDELSNFTTAQLTHLLLGMIARKRFRLKTPIFHFNDSL